MHLFFKGIVLLCALVVSGCVGGPSAYMKEVSSEITSPEPVSIASPQDLAVKPVQSAALEAPAVSNIEQGTTDIAQFQQPASFEAQQPIINDLQSTQASSMMASTDIGNGSETFAPNNSQTPTALPGVAQTQFVQPAPNGQQLALLPTDQTRPAPIGGIDASQGFAIGTPSEPYVDPVEAAAEARIPILYASINHGQCRAGRGPKPRKVNATNITPGDPYYIEIRMRHTPLLPVGHTYVAYGRLSPTGQILDEKLIMLAPVGGYAGAALASGIPMPGVLDPHPDDCRIRPKAAYRISLNAQRYEKLLLDIQKARAEKPSYLLFTYNCNHFASRIAASVGIKPPANIYVPALEYIYAMIDANEGGKIARN